MVGDTGGLGVQVAAAEFFGGHHFAGRGLHQRRAAEEDRALVADDDRFVAHRGYVRAARGAGAEHRGDLRDALGAHRRLVVEDAAEMLAVGEDLVLARQERAARVDQVDAGQPVLPGDLLGAQMLLDRNRVVGAAFHGRVVGHDHAFAPGYPADADDHARARDIRRRTCRRRQAAPPRAAGCRDPAARPPGLSEAACRG